MTRSDYARRLGLAVAISVAVAAVLYLMNGPQWFSFYGGAAALLAALPILAAALWQRLPDVGKSRWWTLAFALPMLALALIQILYWSMFFKTGGSNPTLGIVRGVFWENAGPYLPVAGAALLALWAWLFWSASNDRNPG